MNIESPIIDGLGKTMGAIIRDSQQVMDAHMSMVKDVCALAHRLTEDTIPVPQLTSELVAIVQRSAALLPRSQ